MLAVWHQHRLLYYLWSKRCTEKSTTPLCESIQFSVPQGLTLIILKFYLHHLVKSIYTSFILTFQKVVDGL